MRVVRWLVSALLLGAALVAGSSAAAAHNSIAVTVSGPASISGPLRAANLKVRVKNYPSGANPRELVQLFGAGEWTTLDDGGLSFGGLVTHNGHQFVAVGWGIKPKSTAKIRVVVPADKFAGLTKPIASAPITIHIGNAAVPLWLRHLNQLRADADVPAAAMEAALNRGAKLHARYMYKNEELIHYEDKHNRWYTARGNAAGTNGDEALDSAPIHAWAETAFHQSFEIDPANYAFGFASDKGYASLTSEFSPENLNPRTPYLQFPAPGTTTKLGRFQDEIPSPSEECHALRHFRKPAGTPLEYNKFNYENLFNQNQKQPKYHARLVTRGHTVPVCTFNLYSVTFIIPLRALKAKHSYSVRLTIKGRLAAKWTFHTAAHIS